MQFKPTIALAALTAAAFGAALALAGSCARDAHAPTRAAAPPLPASPAPPPRPARPAVVLLRHAPWAGADAADRPLFVLYDDGRVLVPRVVDGVFLGYRTTRVDFSDPDSALARLGIRPELFRLRPTYGLAADDPGQEAVVLCVWRDGRLTRVAVGVRALGRPTRFADEAPRAFRDAYRALATFKPADAADWRPSLVEVVARPYEYAPDGPPLPWPKGWPGLASPGAAVRGEHATADTVWTIPLPYERLGDLRRLLRRRRTKQAILIDRRKVAVAYRLAFPGEELWRAQLGHLEP